MDGTPIRQALERVGDRGIVRGALWGYGQAGAWQSFCCLVGTEEAIMWAMDDPDWVHHIEQFYVDKQKRVIEMMAGEVPLDLVEIGGGAGSNTVISPKLHAEFCRPPVLTAAASAGPTTTSSTATPPTSRRSPTRSRSAFTKGVRIRENTDQHRPARTDTHTLRK